MQHKSERPFFFSSKCACMCSGFAVQSEGSVSTFYLNNSTLHYEFSKRGECNLNSFSYSPELLQGSQPSVLFASFLLSFLAFKKKHISSKDQQVVYPRWKSSQAVEECENLGLECTSFPKHSQRLLKDKDPALSPAPSAHSCHQKLGVCMFLTLDQWWAQTVVNTYLQEPHTLYGTSLLLLLFQDHSRSPLNDLGWITWKQPGLGDMAHVVKSTDALTEDLGSIPSNHIKQLITSSTSGPREPDTLFWLPWVLCTYRWASTYTNMEIKISFKISKSY